MELPNIGIAGEVRYVVTKADDTVKVDTGYQKNLILNQGLDFFGGGNGNNINAYCAIGSGNTDPTITQTKLDAFIAIATGSDITSDYSYVDNGDGLYRMWEQKRYRFTGLNNVNISEVGLVSTGTTSTNYHLTTRALVKDSLGAPTSISVKTGETLDIYYKIHKVIETADKNFVINVLDGNEGVTPYNAVIRPALVGTENANTVSVPANRPSARLLFSEGDLAPITGNLATSIPAPVGSTASSYIASSYKITVAHPIPLADANIGIRTVSTYGSGNTANNYGFFNIQMRLGRVSDDAPLTKTNKETLTIPLEISWGRYEGEL